MSKTELRIFPHPTQSLSLRDVRTLRPAGQFPNQNSVLALPTFSLPFPTHLHVLATVPPQI